MFPKREHVYTAAKNEELEPSLSLSPTVTEVEQVPQKNEKQRTKKPGFQAWMSLLGHFFLCLTVTLSVAFFLNGYKALAYEWQTRRQPGGGYVFRVSDLTALLSAATTLVDWVGGLWTGLVAWRCALILLEHETLRIDQLSQIIGGVPPFTWLLYRSSRQRRYFVAIVLMCVLPQPYLEPLFSGSVNWNFALDYGPATHVPSGNPAALASSWYWYLAQGINRKFLIRHTGGVVSNAWSATDASQSVNGTLGRPAGLGGVACRRVMPLAAPINSTLQGATIPCIQIHNITWAANGSAPNSLAESAAWWDDNDISLISDGLFGYMDTGVAVLFSEDEPSWDTPSQVTMDSNTSSATFPEATKWTTTRNMTLLFFLGRQDTTGCNPIADSSFGNSSYLTETVPGVFSTDVNSDENCMTWATVFFTAGVITAAESTYVSERAVEWYPGPEEDEATIAAAIEPSIWTREALWLLPDVMTQTAVMNASLLPTWENLNNYTATLIRYSYMASWDTLHAEFDDTDEEYLTMLPAEARLKASVSMAQLISWFGLTLLLPLSGLIVGLMRRECVNPMITDTVALLFTDATGKTGDVEEYVGKGAIHAKQGVINE